MTPKSEIYNPKRDDEHPSLFYMEVTPPPPPLGEDEEVKRIVIVASN